MHANIQALTTNLLPHPLQTALCPALRTRMHTSGHSSGRETQVRDPHRPCKRTQGPWGIKFLGANHSEYDLEGVPVPDGLVKLSSRTQGDAWGWAKRGSSEEQSPEALLTWV